MNRVVVLLKDEELADVKKRAGLIPLSAWFRDLAMGGEPRRAGVATGEIAIRARTESSSDSSGEIPLPPKSKKRGKHFTDTW